MNQWNPYMNQPYDEGYDVDEMMRHHDNNAPALPMMPTAQMPTMHSHSSPCGCHSMPMWDGMYPMGEMGVPGMMPPGAGMPMMPGAMGLSLSNAKCADANDISVRTELLWNAAVSVRILSTALMAKNKTCGYSRRFIYSLIR